MNYAIYLNVFVIIISLSRERGHCQGHWVWFVLSSTSVGPLLHLSNSSRVLGLCHSCYLVKCGNVDILQFPPPPFNLILHLVISAHIPMSSLTSNIPFLLISIKFSILIHYNSLQINAIVPLLISELKRGKPGLPPLFFPFAPFLGSGNTQIPEFPTPLLWWSILIILLPQRAISRFISLLPGIYSMTQCSQAFKWRRPSVFICKMGTLRVLWRLNEIT